MAHHNTILRQIVAFLPRHEFESLAKVHHRGQKFRSFSRWTQFMVLFIGQLSGRKSLRDHCCLIVFRREKTACIQRVAALAV
jgi:hypothetical protein